MSLTREIGQKGFFLRSHQNGWSMNRSDKTPFFVKELGFLFWVEEKFLVIGGFSLLLWQFWGGDSLHTGDQEQFDRREEINNYRYCLENKSQT